MIPPLPQVTEQVTELAEKAKEKARDVAAKAAAVPTEASRKAATVVEDASKRVIKSAASSALGAAGAGAVIAGARVRQARNFVLVLVLGSAFAYGVGSALPKALVDLAAASRQGRGGGPSGSGEGA